MQTKPSWKSVTTLFLCLLLATVGMAHAQDSDSRVEICDGKDNDGDDLIDEGFDMDDDGVARCCSCEPYFATVSRTGERIDAHSRSCSDSAFSPGLHPAFEDPTGATRVQLHAVADFDGNCGLDIVWRDLGEDFGRRKMTSCRQGEWQTVDLEVSDLAYFGGADLDSNGTADLVGWDATCCDITANAGTSALNRGGGLPMFDPEIYPAYDISPIDGSWQMGRVYNLQDLDNDSVADVLFWDYDSGGASDTDIHSAFGNNDGTFGSTTASIATLPNQPQNFGDLGDLDGDGCADWVGGPDDDGNRGAVFTMPGDCAGNLGPATLLVDTCVGCPGSGSWHGAGMSQLYDWTCDGRLDLLTSHVVTTGSTATVQFWDGAAGPASTVLNAASISIAFASPLRNYDAPTCQ